MKKEEIIYNVNLTNAVYFKSTEIDWKGLGIKKVTWMNDSKTDTQGFTALSSDTLYIVWRGSSSPKDFLKDAQVKKVKFVEPGEKVHNGFYTAFSSVKEDLYSSINFILSKKLDKIKSVVICGHSLGAALTVISSYMICKDFPQIAHLVKNVTVGCPRVGNSTFKDNYNKLVPKSIRIVNDKDLVTRIPKIGFTHINEGITLNEKGEVITYSSLNPFRYFIEIFISDISGEAAKDHFVDNYLKVIDKWDGVIKN
jgi:predicted lipase